MDAVLFSVSLAVGFWMAWNIGANDVANSMGTAVGSGALSPRKAAVLAGIMNFLGAYVFGKAVTETIRKGIVNPNLIGNPSIVAYGSLAALIAASLWLLFATKKGLPVSTTHSIVGGVLGYGLAYGGVGMVEWSKVLEVFTSWIFSPILGAFIAYLLYKGVEGTALRRNFKFWAPTWAFLAVLVVTLTFYMKTCKSSVWRAINIGLPLGAMAFLTSHYGIKGTSDIKEAARKTFGKLQVLTSSYVALAHGSNDVANAVGPIAAIYAVANAGTLAAKVQVPKWILALGGLGIAIGILTYGYKVMETVGKRITEISRPKGFSAEFSAASIILAASLLGLPVSTTHIVVGAVVGVGLAKGKRAVNGKLLRDVVISWFVTVPVAALMSALIFKCLLTLAGT